MLHYLSNHWTNTKHVSTYLECIFADEYKYGNNIWDLKYLEKLLTNWLYRLHLAYRMAKVKSSIMQGQFIIFISHWPT